MSGAEEIRAESYVGFDSITQQIEHKLLKRGFQFNVIVVGSSFECSVLRDEFTDQCIINVPCHPVISTVLP